MIRELCETYLATTKTAGRIDWICNHSRNTQIALFRRQIDIALTYERYYEAFAEAEGWSHSHGLVFHDHFVLAGPKSDPAGAFATDDVVQAFKRIAQTKSRFHSRVDGSATTEKERSIWRRANEAPWEDTDALASWYKTSLFGPAEAVINADKVDAYLLTDRSTLVAQVGMKHIHRLTVFHEPRTPDDILMNSCAVLSNPIYSDREEQFTPFITWLHSEQAQQVISVFGVKQTSVPLFARVSEDYAKSSIRGGQPVNGRWLLASKL